MIEFEMLPAQAPMLWNEFRSFARPFGVAIDGFVREGPRFDAGTPLVNFNHHEGSPRLQTRATCAQVLVCIRQGMFQRFRDKSGAKAVVYMNDCDEDVCASSFLLKNHYLAEGTMNPALNRLVHMIDMMDTTAGAYPFPQDLPALGELAWVMAPYREFRSNGGLENRGNPAGFSYIVEQVHHRMMEVLAGRGQTVPLDTRFEILKTGKGGWALVHEIGQQARVGMFASGIRAFVSWRGQRAFRGDIGRWARGEVQDPKIHDYVVGRMSEFVPFPVGKILSRMNEIESLTEVERWGGGDSEHTTIGGSPRSRGSKLTPDEVFVAIEGLLA